jgi:hypothetical protein
MLTVALPILPLTLSRGLNWGFWAKAILETKRAITKEAIALN